MQHDRTVLTGVVLALLVAAECGEHLVGLPDAPPAVLLVIGSLVHAGMGAATPGLWRALLDRACTSVPDEGAAVVRAAARPARRAWSAAHDLGGWAGRGPPAGRLVRSRPTGARRRPFPQGSP